MPFTYKNLWKKLIDERMTKEDLRTSINTTFNTIAKMGKDEYVSMQILDKICSFFNCQPNDIIEYIPDGKTNIE